MCRVQVICHQPFWHRGLRVPDGSDDGLGYTLADIRRLVQIRAARPTAGH